MSVNRTDVVVDGARRRIYQLGTVMTEESRRRRGLIRTIMEEVEKDLMDADGVYLFANDSVVEFYPKFGFRPGKEYGCTRAMSDPYIPLERELRYTRRALELIEKYGFGVTVLTKSDRILEDFDLLCRINGRTKAVVQMTLTTMDERLSRIIEPGVCTTKDRLEVLRKFRDAGVPTVVWICPILLFLNDTPENIAGIVNACGDAGVRGIINFGMGLTLREGNREYFYARLDRHFPGLKERYIRTYGNAYDVPSPDQDALLKLFHERCEKYGIWHDNDQIFRYMSIFEEKEEARQLSFF